MRNLARLAPRGATRILDDGTHEQIPIGEIRAGMRLELLAGERVPVDCTVMLGQSDIDLALVTGESVPESAGPGTTLLAGATNLTGPLVLRAEKPAAESFLARMITLMEAAEGSKAGYKRIADRAAAIYAPAVHLLALATLIGWVFLTGDWRVATINAIAVLIITCPCALALAVPIVHVVASGRLFSKGIMMRDGAALERLAEIDTALFDKTGTLTEGRPSYVGQIAGDADTPAIAASLAQLSRHPLSRALAGAVAATRFAGEVREVPGDGIEGTLDGHVYRLGRAGFATASESESDHSTVWLSRDGETLGGFAFADPARTDAGEMIASVKGLGRSRNRSRFGRPRGAGRSAGRRTRHRQLAGGTDAFGQARRHRRGGRACAHGRGRHQRRAGPARRLGVHGAFERRRYRAQRCRFRADPRQPRCRALRHRPGAAGGAQGPDEFRAGDRLQHRCRAAGGNRPRDAADRGAGHVLVLDPRHAQRALTLNWGGETAERRSEAAARLQPVAAE